MLLASLLCTGCVAYHQGVHHYTDHVDVSDVANGSVATIRGREWNLIGLLSYYCWLELPAGDAKRVTVNAGMVDVVAACSFAGGAADTDSTVTAAFHFDAVAGHEYEIEGRCNDCLRLRDITTREIVAESPYLQEGRISRRLID